LASSFICQVALVIAAYNKLSGYSSASYRVIILRREDRDPLSASKDQVLQLGKEERGKQK
jgi:hypothetical protein